MIFEQIDAGGDRNFAYLVGDETTKRAAVIDPNRFEERILERARKHGLEIVLLVNTHGHHDHTGGNREILSATKARLICGAGGGRDGERESLGRVTLTFLHTPGHTPDSMCILAEEAGRPGKLVTGDTLFVGKVGGTGFGQDARDEYDSLHRKVMALPDDTEIWPGHDVGVKPSSTVGRERKTNPFLLRRTFAEFLDLKKNWAEYKREHGIA